LIIERGNAVTNTSLPSQRRRVAKLESIRARKSKHVVVIFNRTPEADEQSEQLITQGRLDAERLGKELQVIRIGWQRGGC
jgi:hypothetical protein